MTALSPPLGLPEAGPSSDRFSVRNDFPAFRSIRTIRSFLKDSPCVEASDSDFRQP
jgi:hypothetical protein